MHKVGRSCLLYDTCYSDHDEAFQKSFWFFVDIKPFVSILIATNANYPKGCFVEIACTQGNISKLIFRFRKRISPSNKNIKKCAMLVSKIIFLQFFFNVNKYGLVLATVFLSSLMLAIFYYNFIDMEKMLLKPLLIPSGLALLVEEFATVIAAVGKMVGCLPVISTIRLVVA